MKKTDIVKKILLEAHSQPQKEGTGYAPSNIALCKYWGKKNSELNIPLTSSLSISLANKGTKTTVSHCEKDQIILNGQQIPADEQFAIKAFSFLDLFRPQPEIGYRVLTEVNIPVAAGLASSACGFAALVLALNNLYGWELDKKTLSILARLGSGSASRSLWHGFVEWYSGSQIDGLDSYAEPIPTSWPQLRIGLHILESQKKSISSREAMKRTVETSILYQSWPKQVQHDLLELKLAIQHNDFDKLGSRAEQNAMSMHATMLSSWPPILYSKPETVAAMQQVWSLREQGIPIYFTQDAGPNLKLLFLESHREIILNYFPKLEIVNPFQTE